MIVDFVPDRELVIQLPDLSTGAEMADSDGREPPMAGDDLAAGELSNTADEPAAPELVYPPGTEIDVEISFRDGLRRFTSVVRRLDFSFGGSLRIEWPAEGERIQRRSFVRVEVNYSATLRFTDVDGKARELAGRTLDVSAGGARLQLQEPPPEGTEALLELQETPLATTELNVRVLRSGELEAGQESLDPEAGSPVHFWVALELVDVSEALRRELTQFVFDIQREEKRRRLA